MPTKKAAKPASRRRRAPTIEPTTLAAGELALAAVPQDAQDLADAVRRDGGAVLGVYREPIGGHALLLVSLPIERVAPTPFQRDVSPAHVRKLAHAMGKTRRFLDPLIVVRDADAYHTPNGAHRLAALREIGARAVVALLVPQRNVAYQILALNIEKAHSLRERAAEVRRMYRELAGLGDDRCEEDLALELDEPALVTVGFAYEARPRVSGGAYHPVLRRVDAWVPGPLAKAAAERERRAKLVLDLDDAVSAAVEALKTRGLTSPYLRAFVVGRVNPLRFMKGEPPPMDRLLADMTARAARLDATKISPTDLARSGGAPEGEDA